jgi:hypothetical protein
VPDSWYFYLFDRDWGPAFFKLSSYAPYPLFISANGHEWLKRQLEVRGVRYEDLDNGLRSVEDPELAHRLAGSLSAGHLLHLIAKWLPLLPSPLLDADRAAGFNWAFSVRQMEISDTAVFERPQLGRAWFEAAIRDHLSLGRPDKVRIVFGRQVRSTTPGRFATNVITHGVYPRLEIRYKSSGAKAYHILCRPAEKCADDQEGSRHGHVDDETALSRGSRLAARRALFTESPGQLFA